MTVNAAFILRRLTSFQARVIVANGAVAAAWPLMWKGISDECIWTHNDSPNGITA